MRGFMLGKYFLLIMLLSACNQTGGDVQVTPETPAITDVQAEQQKPVQFQTEIIDLTEARVDNIKLAAKACDNIVLNINEQFSFNETVGERSEQRGYQVARVIVDNKKEYEHGGGVCQVSSTIFNAVKLAGLSVVERHQHQKPVYYVKLGDDAAVDYDALDLKFVNDSNHPIRLNVSVENNMVNCMITKE